LKTPFFLMPTYFFSSWLVTFLRLSLRFCFSSPFELPMKRM
jgi:hypothetical protein